MGDTRTDSLMEPPALDGGLPLLGHTLAFAKDPVALLLDGHRRLGEVFVVRIAGRRFTVLSGPAATDAVFRTSDETVGRRRAYRSMTPVFGEGMLFDASPADFDEQIALILPALRGGAVEGYAPVMQREVEDYLSGWGPTGRVDLVEAMSELSVNIAVECLIGAEFRRRVGPDLVRLFRDLKSAGRASWLVHPHLPLPAFRRRDRARSELIELILDAARSIQRDGPEAGRFVSTLMSSRFRDGTAVPEEVAASLLLAIIVAGEHNTAALASWTGALLLRNPEWLAAVLREQEELSGDADGPRAVHQDLRRMDVLRRCMIEAERLHPPTTVLLRDAEQEFSYGSYRIARGSRVMVSPTASHRLPEVFTEPERYDPDRFSAERAEHRGTPQPMLAFGGGRHRCTGMAFAYQEIQIIWSCLLRGYELELVGDTPRPDYSAVTAVPRSPCWVRYSRRGGPQDDGGAARCATT
ncbi:unspecific monooxygenase [Streptomyces ipomoeae 91-03]|uniref:Unspecific monooxygenase n=1 Tax=Streptomyces ipomoeae 91-03 TaxID=698759 RepID=L1KHQ9_9ACTN|nr:unspecific monooxygenase [Streptomyces ipomoeae 91-03]